MKKFNEWLKVREAYENPPSPYIGRDKNKPPRAKSRVLTPEEKKELHTQRRASDNPNWKAAPKKRIEDTDA